MRRGFTVIETLIAMAIVFVLSALVAAVIRSAMTSGKVASCASNLKSLFVATRLYAQDFGMDSPYSTYRFRGGRDTTSDLVRCLQAYGAKQWKCPMDRKFGASKSGHEVTSYNHGAPILAYLAVLPNGMMSFSLDSVPQPSTFEYFLDILDIDTDDKDPEGNPRSWTQHGNNMMNILYGDGHIKHLRRVARRG